MRNDRSLDDRYFERLYASDPDPWGFETSNYEHARYRHTLDSLPKPRFRRTLEIGCANGLLTTYLAERCDHLVAVDVVDRVLMIARARCSLLPNVSIQKARIPRDRPAGPFDLVLLSEVAYYWDSEDLAAAAEYFRDVTVTGGYLLLVHWTGDTDYPKSGDEAVEELKDRTRDHFRVVKRERLPRYRLDLWRRCPP